MVSCFKFLKNWVNIGIAIGNRLQDKVECHVSFFHEFFRFNRERGVRGLGRDPRPIHHPDGGAGEGRAEPQVLSGHRRREAREGRGDPRGGEAQKPGQNPLRHFRLQGAIVESHAAFYILRLNRLLPSSSLHFVRLSSPEIVPRLFTVAIGWKSRDSHPPGEATKIYQLETIDTVIVAVLGVVETFFFLQ